MDKSVLFLGFKSMKPQGSNYLLRRLPFWLVRETNTFLEGSWILRESRGVGFVMLYNYVLLF